MDMQSLQVNLVLQHANRCGSWMVNLRTDNHIGQREKFSQTTIDIFILHHGHDENDLPLRDITDHGF